MTKTKWQSKLLSLSIAFALVFSLVAMVVPVAVADTGDWSIEVATDKDTYRCCSNITVTATIWADSNGVANVTSVGGTEAGVTFPTNDIEYVSGPTFSGNYTGAEWGFNISGDQLVNAVWILHCTGPGYDEIEVAVDANSEEEISDSVFVRQIPKAELVTDIALPEVDAEVSVGQTFLLTFNVTNTGTGAATDVMATINPIGCGVGDFGEGVTMTIFVADTIAADATVTKNVTMTCTSVGDSSIHVQPIANDECSGEEMPQDSCRSKIRNFVQVFSVTCNATPNPTKVGHNVTFTAVVGEGAVYDVSYNWTFGDWDSSWTAGTSSSSPITVYHTYNTSGTYNVTCNVTDQNSVSVICSATEVVVYPALNVTAALRSGTYVVLNATTERWGAKTDTEVCFNATRGGGLESPCYDGSSVVYSWAWDFGDALNSTSAEQNPCFNYTTAGNYTATVLLTDDCLGNRATANVTIAIYEELSVNCTADPLVTKVSRDQRDVVTFNATKTGGFPDSLVTYTWLWEFGDGNDAHTQNTTHQYANNGTFVAVVTVWDGTALNNTANCTKTIVVHPALNVTCDVTPTAQTICEEVDFTATKTGGVPRDASAYNWTWEFTDGTSTEYAYTQNVTMTFLCVGNWTGTVTVTDTVLGNTANCTTEEVIVTIVPPELFAPELNETVLSRWVTFNWTDIGCVNYTLEVWQKDGTEKKVLRVDTGLDSTWTGWMMDGDAYLWTVTAKDACNNTAVSEESFFLVQDSYLDVSVDAPTTGDSFAGGSTATIIWSTTRDDARASGFGATGDELIEVALSYSTNSGTSWVPIATNQDPTGSRAWTVPAVTSANCLIKAVATDGYGIEGVGISGLFSIVDTLNPDLNAPVVTVNRPVGGETFIAGSQEFILWNATDDVTAQSAIAIALSYKVGTGIWTSITFDGTNDGEFKWTLPEIDSTQVLVKVDATDAALNTGFDVSNEFAIVTEEVVVPVTSYNITLNAGWNLVSLPLIPNSNNISAVLAGVSGTGNVTQVWAYDPTLLPGDAWLSCYTHLSWAANELKEMNDGVGYWVVVQGGTATLTVNGQCMPDPGEVPPMYDVYAGWNLIGMKSTITRSHDDYLANVAGDYTVIWGYDTVSGNYELVYPFPPGSGAFNPGEGFWIYMSADGMIIPTGC